MKKILLLIVVMMSLSGYSVAQEPAGDKPHSLNNPNFISTEIFNPEVTNDGARFWISKDLVLEDTVSGELGVQRVYVRDSLYSPKLRSRYSVATDSSRTLILRTPTIDFGEAGTIYSGSSSNISIGSSVSFNNYSEIDFNSFAFNIGSSEILSSLPLNVMDDITSTGDISSVNLSTDSINTEQITYTQAITPVLHIYGTDVYCDSSSVRTYDLTGSTTLEFNNFRAGQSITIVVTDSGGNTLAFDDSETHQIYWTGGVAPTQTADSIDAYTFIKVSSSMIIGSYVQDLIVP